MDLLLLANDVILGGINTWFQWYISGVMTIFLTIFLPYVILIERRLAALEAAWTYFEVRLKHNDRCSKGDDSAYEI